MTSAGPVLWIILAGVVLVAVLLVVAGLVLRSAMKGSAGKLSVPGDPQRSLIASRDSAVESSFESGLQSLRQRVLGGSFQYRVPWILMIGTPGSGKTAILDSLSSGALSPSGDVSLKGLGIGWGFLNDGVVIDAPGSLLLGPGAGEQSDESGWNQMLRRLNRHRPARPLDGVVLTISAAELLDSTVDIASKGSLIRAKLDQLQSAAGLVLPVYVLVTKCDSLRGFGSFCQEIQQTDPELKKEMFGWSNDHTLESVFTWVWVDEALTTLHRTLRAHQLKFFGTERTMIRADDLFRFPAGFQTLRDPLRNFLTQLFVPVSYRDSHYFRGVYFSGLPSEPGTAADGSELAVIGDRGRTRLPLFFLEHLFDKKVFVEKTLARPVPQRFFFRNRIVMGAQIFSAVFSMMMAIGLTVAYFRLS
ncbi:MAG: type secretion system protein ImpL, partial [Bryobacterales bacterium]|nr:type secretion system protein ImpL [Bryobacterales bacterium]